MLSESTLPYSVQLAKEVTLNWDVDEVHGVLTAELVVQSQAWVGFGWHCWNCPNSGMAKADFSIGIFTNGNVIIHPKFFPYLLDYCERLLRFSR